MFLIEGLCARFHLSLLTKYSTNRHLFNESMAVRPTGMRSRAAGTCPALCLAPVTMSLTLTKELFKDTLLCPQIAPAYCALFRQPTAFSRLHHWNPDPEVTVLGVLGREGGAKSCACSDAVGVIRSQGWSPLIGLVPFGKL